MLIRAAINLVPEVVARLLRGLSDSIATIRRKASDVMVRDYERMTR
jgi:hypothetical protein